MPAPIVLSTLTPETKRVPNPPEGQPVIATKAELRDGSRPGSGGGPSEPAPQGLIFSDNFDDQPDWHSGLPENDLGGLKGTNVKNDPDRLDGADLMQLRSSGHTLPDGWDAVRQNPVWAESFGDTGFPENIEILAANSDKTRTGTGKSLVVYRQSPGDISFAYPSDGQIDTKLAIPRTEVFVRFWVRFSDNWTAINSVSTGATKIFRVASIDEGGDPFAAFTQGDASAIFLWSYSHSNNFGVRQDYTTRGDPQETNYGIVDPPLPNKAVESGSHNFQGHIRDLNGDGIEDNVVTLPSLVTGNPVGSDSTAMHADVWGTAWRKMEFYVKMNSDPGALDGVLAGWMDDQLILRNVTVPWQGNDAPGGIKWTHVGFGGNAHFNDYPAEDRRTEWRAYDDIEIYDSLPEGKTI